MHRDRLSIAAGCALEGARQSRVVIPQRFGGEPVDDRLANAVVDGLNDVTTFAKPHACETLGDDLRDEHVDRTGSGHGRGHDGYGQGSRADADELDDRAPGLRQPLEAMVNDLIEREVSQRVPVTVFGATVIAPDQLLDQEGASPGLARHRARHALGPFALFLQERKRETLRIRQTERPDRHAADLRPCRPSVANLCEKRTGGRIIAARHQKQDRRRRGAHQVQQEARAVHVAPVDVIDEEHERFALRQGTQEAAQCREGARAQSTHVVRGRLGRGFDAPYALQDRKEMAQGPGIHGHVYWVAAFL